MKDRHSLVLFSGGMDSVALLHQARRRCKSTEALFVDYGQLNGEAEKKAVLAITDRWRVPLHMARAGDAVQGVFASAPTPGAHKGISHANMPARNLILLAIAASVAGQRWGDPAACHLGGGAEVTILLGATFDDQQHFPDCRRDFELAASVAVALSVQGLCWPRVRFPFRKLPKAMLLDLCRARWPEALEDILEHSVSCYAGSRCGACDACRVRARAFNAAHLVER